MTKKNKKTSQEANYNKQSLFSSLHKKSLEITVVYTNI